MTWPIPIRRLRSLLQSLHIPTSRRRRFQRSWPDIDSIEGYLVPGQEWWLYETAYKLQPQAQIVEIGSFKGRSTACLALGCVGSQKSVYCIDTFNGNDSDFGERAFFGEFRKNLERLNLFQYVRPLVGTSREIAEHWNSPIDFLFIDGSHQYEDVLSDFDTYFPHVRDGGLVAFHDVTPNWPGPFAVWNDVARPRLRNTGQCTTLAFGFK
jgi:hypothetical protein